MFDDVRGLCVSVVCVSERSKRRCNTPFAYGMGKHGKQE